MKQDTKRFKNLAVALKELEPCVRDGNHLLSGRPFRNFGGMRSREALANLLICIAANSELGADRMTFTSDPSGSDGIILDTLTEETWITEHVMVTKPSGDEPVDSEDAIVRAVERKQSKVAATNGIRTA